MLKFYIILKFYIQNFTSQKRFCGLYVVDIFTQARIRPALTCDTEQRGPLSFKRRLEITSDQANELYMFLI